MRTTKQLIKAEIIKTAAELIQLRRLEETVKDEPSQKECPNCKTVNYHFEPKTGTWCCAFC